MKTIDVLDSFLSGLEEYELDPGEPRMVFRFALYFKLCNRHKQTALSGEERDLFFSYTVKCEPEDNLGFGWPFSAEGFTRYATLAASPGRSGGNFERIRKRGHGNDASEYLDYGARRLFGI